MEAKKFSRLTVLHEAYRTSRDCVRWKCLCDCGNEIIALGTSLKSGHTRSCGCLTREKARSMLYRHGESRTPLYSTWKSMRQRCSDPLTNGYERYGGRGIVVCREWNGSFLPFRDWALAHGWKPGMQIDRLDNNGDYRPSNCRVVTPTENMNNKSNCHYITFCGKTMSVADWARERYISRNTSAADKSRDGYRYSPPVNDLGADYSACS